MVPVQLGHQLTAVVEVRHQGNSTQQPEDKHNINSFLLMKMSWASKAIVTSMCPPLVTIHIVKLQHLGTFQGPWCLAPAPATARDPLHISWGHSCTIREICSHLTRNSGTPATPAVTDRTQSRNVPSMPNCLSCLIPGEDSQAESSPTEHVLSWCPVDSWGVRPPVRGRQDDLVPARHQRVAHAAQ